MKRCYFVSYLLLFTALLTIPFPQLSAQCGSGQTLSSNCYEDNETNEVIFEICPTSGMAAQVTIIAGTYGSFDATDNLSVYEGTSGSGTSGTLYFGPAMGNLAGTMITGSTDQCLIFVSNSNSVISCNSGFETDLEVCSESVADGTVQFSVTADLCSTDGVQSGLGGGFPFGGTYSGTGVTDDGNGTSYSFNPATAGVGVHTVTYTVGLNSVSDDLEVFSPPSVTFTAPADLCIDAGIQTGLGGATPTGGVYSGPGVTDDRNGMTYTFNPAIAGLGVHTITYTEETPCGITATDNIEVLAACGCPSGQSSFFHCSDEDEINLVIFEVCPDAGEIAKATVEAGTFDFGNTLTIYQGSSGSSTSGTLVYGPQRGDLAGEEITADAVDDCLIFVSNSTVLSCQMGFDTPLEVCGESIENSFVAPDDLCIDEGVQTGLSGGLPTGGVYSGPGVTDDGNGMTFSFDPASAGAGVQTITYTVSGNPVTDDIEVFAVPTVSFMAPADVCLDAGVQQISSGGSPVGGTYSGPGVTDGGDGTSYSFDPIAAGLGVHTITYTEGSACMDIATDNIEVLAACNCPSGETAFFNCYANNETNLVIFEVCPSSGEFAKAEISQGTYGSSDDALTVYQGATGSGTGGTIVFGPSNGNLSGNTIISTVADDCLIFVSNSGPAGSCGDNFESALLVCGASQASNVTFTALDDLSFNAGLQTGLSGGLPTGGVYSGPGVTDDGNGMTYSFHPPSAGLGTHTLTYTTGAGSASDDVEVFNLIPPSFSKSFNSSSIGIGSVSTLTFVIDNSSSGSSATSLAFTDNLPAGMTVADPPNVISDCGIGGTITATAGSSSISFSGGSIGANSSCTISVNVTSSTVGTHTNTTGDLTSSAGNSGTASANLTVANDRPRFTKSFSPSSIFLNGRSTLTFTIDNTVSSGNMNSLNFTDNLPDGMVIASPANISISCTGGTLTAEPGTSVIIYDYPFTFPALAAGNSCTISVDVTGTTLGTLNNVSGNLTGFNASFATVTSGYASAALEVTRPAEILIEKSFSTNPVLPGGTTNLEFTIKNFDRDFAATNVSFTDDLTTVLSGLTATGTPLTNICGTGSQISGTTSLSFTGGTVPAGGSCTFSVPLSVPAGATPGIYTNTTSAVTGDIDGTTITGNSATEDLTVQFTPTFTKTFLSDPIPAGGTTTMEFTITNTSSTENLTNISFTDPLDFISGATITVLPATGSCGAGSIFFTSTSAGITTFNVTGANIPAGSSCTFTADVMIQTGTAPGTYTNTTSSLTATLGSNSISADAATADLTILAVPRITKSFTDDPVDAGNVVNLEFTISHDANASGDATNISFTDDLNAVIAGMSASGLPINDVCGVGSQISGTTNLTFTGGTLSPGSSCTFSVPVTVPAGTNPGSYTNTTSALSATVGGQSATGNAATDDLLVGGVNFSKEFIDGPYLPGDLATLRFTIDNTTTLDATSIIFTDNLSGVLSGMAAEAPLPTGAAACNGTLSGTTFLIYVNGSVPGGTTCTMDVPVRIPVGAANGTYNNVTSNLTTTFNGTSLTLPTAAAQFEVNNSLITLDKVITDDPVLPGGVVTVEYTLRNLSDTKAISNIAFTDDFDSALSGLQATGLPMSVCSGTVSGTSTLSFSGGSLAAGDSCKFTVSLQTPSSAAYGSSVTTTTSSLTGESSGVAVVGDAASDVLDFQLIQFTKSFAGRVAAGQTATLTFTLTNPDLTNSVSDIRFTDDLDAFISGMVATNLPLSNTCGTGSTVTGTSTIVFNNGSLAAGASCSFDVSVSVPLTTTPATYTNVTSMMSLTGALGPSDVDAATTDLIVDAQVPLELLRFEGYQIEQMNILNWTTASELNTKHFIIERSSNGINFKAIGTPILAAGNSNANLEYSFTDQAPLRGMNYYRLRMVDLDESFAYSQVVPLLFDSQSGSEISVVPIPTKRKINISFYSTHRESSVVKVLDITGRVVQQQAIQLQQGQNALDMDLIHVPPGVYFVQIDSPQFGKSVKIVKDE